MSEGKESSLPVLFHNPQLSLDEKRKEECSCQRVTEEEGKFIYIYIHTYTHVYVQLYIVMYNLSQIYIVYIDMRSDTLFFFFFQHGHVRRFQENWQQKKSGGRGDLTMKGDGKDWVRLWPRTAGGTLIS